jgi:ABC-type multidrug transport system fused ATPase/permease subunit
LRRPTVLLLDEATSALDPENEQKVQKSLEKLMAAKTTLNITHRLETIEHYERVYMVSNKAV